MKSILITGGIGFIGTSLALNLISHKYRIILFDIRDNNKGEKIYVNNENIDFIQGDTNDTKLLESIFKANIIDGVVHLAAVSRVVIAERNPTECLRINVGGTKSLLAAIDNLSTKPWLIFGSSREVYGEPKELPVKESFDKNFVNIYGNTKIQGENLCVNFAKKNHNSCVVLRFANVYGNQYDLFDRVIPRFINAIVNSEPLIIEGGNQLIDFTHISDTVNTIIKAIKHIENNKLIIDDFHILPGIGWSLYEAITYIEEIVGKKAITKVNPKRNYDVEKFIGDDSKIKKVLKSRKFLSLKEGLQISVPTYITATSKRIKEIQL
jgi:nucleoside-diphosphate-sugar epimerase